MRALRAIAPGDDPVADELIVGLDGLQSILLEMFEARGPLRDVDVTADYTAGENQRVRIQSGYTVNVTLPNAVPVIGYVNPADYGFLASSETSASGTTSQADGVRYRQPYDGSRVEIVGTSQAAYFYRADINAWKLASGLALDDEAPLNDRLRSALASLTAERLLDVLGSGQMTPALQSRISRARVALFVRPGVKSDPVRPEYF